MIKKEEPKKAREFCFEVRKIAEKYNLPFFVVTDGASATSNNGNEAVKHARTEHEKWELKTSYDPNDSWSSDDLK